MMVWFAALLVFCLVLAVFVWVFGNGLVGWLYLLLYVIAILLGLLIGFVLFGCVYVGGWIVGAIVGYAFIAFVIGDGRCVGGRFGYGSIVFAGIRSVPCLVIDRCDLVLWGRCTCCAVSESSLVLVRRSSARRVRAACEH